jgi:radical SAM-linked protein
LEEVFVLKIRIKYSKLGNLKFIGHLDVMRYFQKEIRRAKLDISYSKGYSPHQIISFAAPLALGITSDGEYFDAEFNSVTTSTEMIEALNAVSVDEIHVTKCVQIPEDAKNAMSIVAASDYEITFREQNVLNEKLLASVDELNKQDEIIVLKKTKKSEKEENIRPGILKLERRGDGIYMLLQTGSVYNLKPELVVKALYDLCGETYDFFRIYIHRLETYYDKDGSLQPLYMAGEEF